MSKRYWASRDMESTALLVWFDRKPRMDSAGNFWVGSLFNRGHAFIAENTINLNPGECVEIEPVMLVRKSKKRSVKRGK